MRVGARFALASLTRAPAAALLRLFTLAAAVALLAAMLLFVQHALATMTQSSVRKVAIDWQGPVVGYRAAQAVARDVAGVSGIAEAAPSATAPFAGIVHRSATGTIRAGAGAILAVPPTYQSRIAAFRLLRGSVRPGEITLDQQLAATLQAAPGDLVSLNVRAGESVLLRVSGVALVSAADALFQPLNPLLGPAPAQPPANIAIVPLSTFASRIAPLLTSITSAAGASAIPGSQTGTQWQVQTQLDPAVLSGSPAHALRQSTRLRNRVERSLPGRVVFVDNLADELNAAAGDALYAETLYIMLALPGALVALGLVYLAALGTAERDRLELALLRARGASRRQLVWVAAVESVLFGICGGVLGTASALAALHLVDVSGSGWAPAHIAAVSAVSVSFACVGAAAARFAAGQAAFRGTVTEARRGVQRTTTPLWQRLYLDVIALAVAGLVYWLTARTGFSAVINPDSNPTLSLSAYMFLAPALLWLGSALVLLRLRGRLIGAAVARVGGARAHTPTSLFLVSAGRRGRAMNRGLLVLGLLLAFAVNLALFSATYDQQARVDAQLTLGADVVATAPAETINKSGLVARLRLIDGVAAVTALDHSYAYVGPDLQDTYGIDPATFAAATTLRDSYFLGAGARDTLARMRARADAILVSKETISDYSLHTGDLLRLRVLNHASGRFRIASFHVVGVVQEFPSAPRDSFMVANLDYIAKLTHDHGANTIFLRSHRDPRRLARVVAQQTHTLGVSVRDIRHQNTQTVSSITSVSLRGITRIEEAFVLVLALAAITLYVGLGLAERRRELATMSALGTSLARIGGFIYTEAAIILAAAYAFSALLGLLLAEMLIAMLQHVFDPPPDHISVPWRFLLELAAVTVAGWLLAAAVATLRIRRLPVGVILREE